LRPGRIHALAVVLFCTSILPSILVKATTAQDNKELSWQNRLYESEVRYENFACRREDSETVAAFFREHPLLGKIFPICHNDCPVIKCRPVIPFPAIANSARGTGAISVHVLVNEEGKAIYARILAGHPLLGAAARRAACETQFNAYPDHKRQGVMHFTADNSGYLGVPYGANQVR
jgi:outer membrane biosynthesis protein TonB